MRLPPLVRILRPALAPTAAADVLAAAAFAGGADPMALASAAAGSICLYTAGMAQNDLCDRAVDREKQPDRPLVVEPALFTRALLLMFCLFAAGVGLAAYAGALWPAVAVVVLASAYNLGLKRIWPADAFAIGGARAANLWIGFAVAGAFSVWYAALYLLFIAAVSSASRAEDMEPAQTRRLVLLLAVLPKLGAMLGLALLTGGTRALAFLVPATLQMRALVPAMRAGDRGGAKLNTLRSLLNIFALHAAVLWAVAARDGLIAVLVCAAASYFLLGLFAPPRKPADVT